MARPRVLMIAPHFPPRSSAGVFRTVRFAKYLPEFGWEPVVLTAPVRPDGQSTNGELLEQLPADLVVERTPSTGHAGRTGRPQKSIGGSSVAQSMKPQRQAAAQNENNGKPASRPRWRALASNLWGLLSQTPDQNVGWVLPAVRRGVRLACQHGVRVIYTSGPPHSTHLVGYLVKRLTGRPWVADFRDPWARRPWGPKDRNPWGQRLDPWLERLCIRAADRVVLNTERMAEDFQTHYAALDPAKFVAIPNGCDPDLAPKIERLLAEAASVPKDGVIRLCHPGSLYRKRDPRPIVDAIGQLHRRGLHVVFEQIGPCAADFDLPSYLKQRGLADRVILEDHLPHDEVLCRMAEADLLAVIQPGTPIQIPGKLFEMLLFRKPILAIADEGATADVVRRFHLGTVAPGDDPQAIAEALADLVENAERYRRHGQWTEAQNAFDGRNLTGRLAKALYELAGMAEATNARPDVARADRALDGASASKTCSSQSQGD